MRLVSEEKPVCRWCEQPIQEGAWALDEQKLPWHIGCVDAALREALLGRSAERGDATDTEQAGAPEDVPEDEPEPVLQRSPPIAPGVEEDAKEESGSLEDLQRVCREAVREAAEQERAELLVVPLRQCPDCPPGELLPLTLENFRQMKTGSFSERCRTHINAAISRSRKRTWQADKGEATEADTEEDREPKQGAPDLETTSEPPALPPNHPDVACWVNPPEEKLEEASETPSFRARRQALGMTESAVSYWTDIAEGQIKDFERGLLSLPATDDLKLRFLYGRLEEYVAEGNEAKLQAYLHPVEQSEAPPFGGRMTKVG